MEAGTSEWLDIPSQAIPVNDAREYGFTRLLLALVAMLGGDGLRAAWGNAELLALLTWFRWVV